MPGANWVEVICICTSGFWFTVWVYNGILRRDRQKQIDEAGGDARGRKDRVK